ncbi:hypothetical protein QQX98_003159 [Neonectria punicea]|uniref:NmrA-like domain-containing protein n=1 Tax=Neonectria punicea TaxID=979145 RepID=A0ABR1HF28_9HYPO
MATDDKVICVIGATGNQGGSVARRFRKAGFSKLAIEGIEVVKVDLDNVDSLISVFHGANVIFSVTNYWEPFFRPDYRQKTEELGISCRKLASDAEYQQGKNVADAAAATVDANGFLVSTLSHAGKCSQGAFTELYHFDAKVDIFPIYVQDKYPELASKMSCVQTGFFFTSFNTSCPTHTSASFQMAFTASPDKPVPHLVPVGDMGNFVYAVYQMPAGKEYMAEGTTCSWSGWIKTWGSVTGLPVSYRQVSAEEMIDMTGNRDTGIEVANMFSYGSDPGYDGGVYLF